MPGRTTAAKTARRAESSSRDGVPGAIFWSIRHRAERLYGDETAELDATLDQLNNERTRNLQAKLQDRVRCHDDIAADAVLPPGLTVDDAAALIDRCRGFVEIAEVRLPNGDFERDRSAARKVSGARERGRQSSGSS